jgi:hypothetical protein
MFGDWRMKRSHLVPARMGDQRWWRLSNKPLPFLKLQVVICSFLLHSMQEHLISVSAILTDPHEPTTKGTTVSDVRKHRPEGAPVGLKGVGP